MLGNKRANVIPVGKQSIKDGRISRCLPDSVCVLSQALVLPFPEDLRVGNPRDATLQPHRMALGHAAVLQLLHEHRHLVHLFGCGDERGTESLSRFQLASTQIQSPPTCNDQLQVEGVLAGPVAGDAGVYAGIAAGHRLYDQGVHAVFPHQHLVGGVRADALSVQLPDEVRGGQAAHLQAANVDFTHDG